MEGDMQVGDSAIPAAQEVCVYIRVVHERERKVVDGCVQLMYLSPLRTGVPATE